MQGGSQDSEDYEDDDNYCTINAGPAFQKRKKRLRNKFNQTLDARANQPNSFSAAQNMMHTSLMGFDKNYNDSFVTF